jgi:hypothetical protein
MKSSLLALAAMAVFAQPVAASGPGRYQVATGPEHTVLVDTRTGRTWVLAPAEYKAGSPQERRYEWDPIGFMHSHSLTPPPGNGPGSPKTGAQRTHQ